MPTIVYTTCCRYFFSLESKPSERFFLILICLSRMSLAGGAGAPSFNLVNPFAGFKAAESLNHPLSGYLSMSCPPGFQIHPGQPATAAGLDHKKQMHPGSV